MRNSRGETIGIQDMEDTATFLLYHMSMETRRKFMAQRPVLYAQLFPEVPAISITERVRDAIALARGEAPPLTPDNSYE